MPNGPFAPTGVQLSAAVAEEFQRVRSQEYGYPSLTDQIDDTLILSMIFFVCLRITFFSFILRACGKRFFSRQSKKTVLSVEQLRSKLLEHHPDWKIPDRRVKKFLKRHVRKHGDPSCADDDDDGDDDTTVASATVPLRSPFKSPGKRLRSIFGFHRQSGTEKKMMTTINAPESAPESLLPPLASEAASPKNEEEEIIETKVEELSEPVPVSLDQARSVEQVYRDDNDGSKSKDCCSVEACAIM